MPLDTGSHYPSDSSATIHLRCRSVAVPIRRSDPARRPAASAAATSSRSSGRPRSSATETEFYEKLACVSAAGDSEELVNAVDDGMESAPPEADVFSGEVRVASKVVDFLSSGLYQTPAACLKELVNNSYDADAKRVEVHIKPVANEIIVADDGLGLTREEFVSHFERVSESHKRDHRSITPSGRPMIGRIGIGMIAANELCDEMEIVSTKKGVGERLRVTIDFEEMRKDPLGKSRREEEDDGGGAVFKKGDYSGWVEEAPKSHHYTRIFMRRIRPSAQKMFAGIPREAETAGEASLYGLEPATVVERLADPELRSWSHFDEYTQTMLAVGLNVPVRYAPRWIPGRLHRSVAELEAIPEELDFTVLYDGTDLRKPTVLRGPEGCFVRRFHFEGEHVSASGYIFAKRRALRPQELNGVLIRIRNAAVGEYDPGWLDYSATLYPLFKDWLSAEIWADDRLEDALNIDRRTLRVTHEAYTELQAAFHEQLTKVLGEARETFYNKRSQSKRTERAQGEIERMQEIASEHGVRLPPSPIPSEPKSAPSSPESKRAVRRAITSRSVSEVYELALEVAREQLNDVQYRRFAEALAKRLLD